MKNELPDNTVMIPSQARPLDLSKPVQTRDGRAVRILCTDANRCEPIVGLIIFHGGNELIGSWRIDGSYLVGRESSSDLVNVPPPKRKSLLFVELRRDVEDGDLYGVATVHRPPHKTEHIVLASTTIEMEYEEPQA